LEGTGQKKLNCWEHKKCGRQPGGYRTTELGICPVTTYVDLDGIHNGRNAGRACWAIAGSLCGGKVQGTFAEKLHNCWRCEFMKAVQADEEQTPLGFSTTRLGMDRTREKQRQASEVMAQASSIESSLGDIRRNK
jgi:hypothetical protein